jgi:two-component system, cell cycle sensor histidine kinase and response regulator CckA
MNHEQNQAEEAHRTSEEWLRSMLRAAMDGFWMLAPDGRLLEVNNAYCRMSGYSEPELLAMSIPDLEVFETGPEVTAHIAKVIELGQDRFETRHRRKDGSIFDVEVSAQYCAGEDGRVFAFLRDITEHKRAELALQQEQELYEDLVNTLPAGAYRLRARIHGDWRTDTWRTMAEAQYSLDFASDRFCAILGIARQALAADPGVVSDLIHPADQENFNARNAEAMRDFNPFVWEGRIINGQQIRWVHLESLPRLIDSETVLWTGILYDITELKRTEQALRERKEQLRVIFNTSQAGIILVGSQGTILLANNRMAEMFGMSLSQLIGTSYPDHLHPAERELGDERMGQLIRGEIQSVAVERHYRRADGSDFWGFLSGKRIENPDGTLRALVGIIADLTEQKKLQEQLGQAQKMESVGRLAGGVAHDFNNMLSVILGHTELARAKVTDSPPLREHLEQIQLAAERSAAIVRQLLAFARKQTVTPSILDLNEIVESMLKMLRRLIGENIDLVWLPGKVLWSVKMDPAQIDQILANLCVNARDAVADIGRITIETGNVTVDPAFCAAHSGFSPGEYVLLTVSDDGCGMDQETLKNIFEPFFTTKGVGQGTGLGLAMVYGIVKQNAGCIDVDSEPGLGTRFKIYLPRHLKGMQARTGTMEPASRGHETILLVEDEPAILDLGKELLEMQGYRVLTAGTPGEALRLAEEHSGEIHLLLTDVIMPGMNGRELAEKLLSFYPGLKELFMSGYTADVIAHRGVLDSGMQFIQKPFSLATLTNKVREVLDD